MSHVIALIHMLTWRPIRYIERSRGQVKDDGRDTLCLLDEGPIGVVVQADAVGGRGVVCEHGA